MGQELVETMQEASYPSLAWPSRFHILPTSKNTSPPHQAPSKNLCHHSHSVQTLIMDYLSWVWLLLCKHSNTVLYLIYNGENSIGNTFQKGRKIKGTSRHWAKRTLISSQACAVDSQIQFQGRLICNCSGLMLLLSLLTVGRILSQKTFIQTFFSFCTFQSKLVIFQNIDSF